MTELVPATEQRKCGSDQFLPEVIFSVKNTLGLCRKQHMTVSQQTVKIQITQTTISN